MLAQLSFLFLLGAGAALAQSVTAQITGQITDASGAVIPRASVRAVNTGTGVSYEGISNDFGAYTVPLLPPGEYRITVEKEGFRSAVRGGIRLQVDQVARIDFVLDVGAVTEQVEVTGTAPLLSQETSSLGQVIDNQKVVNIPLNGRSPFRLVLLTAGVVGSPSVNGQFGDIPVNTQQDSDYSINGGQAHNSEVLIDGVPATTGPVNTMTTIPTVESTQEFKVESNNLSAEFGRFSGGVINVSSRSGTNALHGTLFEFLRHSALDSNDFFNNKAGRERPPFRMNQFGGAVGGPVELGRLYHGRNRTFFFADFQGTRWRRGDVYITTVPTSAEMAGDFSQSLNNAGQMLVVFDPVTTRPDPTRPGQFVRDPFPGNTLPSSRIDPVARKIASYYPAPNVPGDPLTHTNNFVSNAGRAITKDEFSGRIDHNVSGAYRLFLRFSKNYTRLQQPDYFGNVATPGSGNAGKAIFHYTTIANDHTVVLSPNSFLNFRYGLARMYQYRPTRSYGFDQRNLGMPDSLVRQYQLPVFPAITVEGYAGLAGNAFQLRGYNTHSFLSSWSRLSGRHNLKIGSDVRLRQLNQITVSAAGGSYNFQRLFTRGPDPNRFTANSGIGFATLLLGTPTTGSVNIIPGISQQNWYVAGYVQDSIRLTARLTVNLGLRYETESPYTERRNGFSWFDPTLPSPVRNAAFPDLMGGLRFAGDGSRHVYSWDKNNFAPRGGIAYSIDNNTVFRVGVGLFYGGLEISSTNTGTFPTTGFSSNTTMAASLDGLTPHRYISNPFPEGLVSPARNALGAATGLGERINLWDNDPATPYALQWNANLQRTLPGNLLIDVAYAANRGIKLARDRNIDALNPQYLSLGTALQKVVPNPFYGRIPSGTLSQPNISQRQLLLPYPQYAGLTIMNSTSGNSIYHSMQLKVEKRMAGGSGILFSYTVSKMISDSKKALAEFGDYTQNMDVQNWYDLRAERSLSDIDVPQSAAFSYVLQLPFSPGRRYLGSVQGIGAKLLEGWGLSGVAIYRSGFPLAVRAPDTGAGAGSGTRPNSTGRSARITASRSQGEALARWFDTSVFTAPPPFTFGNVGRVLPDTRGPGIKSIDAALIKDTEIAEGKQIQFRAEAFNLTNTPQFWLPNTTLGSLQFGQISSTSGLPRVIQFSLKLLF